MSHGQQTDSERKPQVTVVVVTYQSRNTIGATLDSLRESCDAGLAVVVVDNASNDGTADFVAAHAPWATLVRGQGNIGFGRGCNRGFDLVATPYVLLLNPDAVIAADALTRLLTFMEQNPQVGICGPAVQEPSGELQPTGALPDPWKIMLRPILPGWAERDMRHVVPGERPQATDWVCGSIMLLRWKMIEEIGRFDPRFFLYFEETDLCRRARRAGWEIWTVGEAVAEHVNAASAKATGAHMMWDTIAEHYFRSRFYYLIKHFGWPAAVTAELGELLLMTVRAAGERLRGRSYKSLGLRLRSPILKLPVFPD
ncbi:glycosyltransferase family 2 protein [Desulfurivibrio sp. D14AmB]|uniref:glycosyltransferase family 2 protein n=1 Tax=Desulfurivibrio sp. D14AmB TaxID=3374370 RepID=UPI00376EBEFF